MLRERSRLLTAALLASGLDGPNVHVYRQSRVPAVTELATLLSNVTGKGLLNRAHAYKASVAANARAGRDPDHGINMGLFSYPVLMAHLVRGPPERLLGGQGSVTHARSFRRCRYALALSAAQASAARD